MIIRFKEVDEAFLKTLLHYIPKEEYNLISGIKFPVTDNDMAKARKIGYIPYHGVNVSIDLIEENPSEESVVFGQEYLDLVDHLSKSFIHCKDVVDALYPGIKLNKNVLLYGKGGHGKSEMTESFFEKALELGMISEKPFVQAFGEGLTEEALFGGLDMKLFMDKEHGTGEYSYLVENSFMNHEVVVFEELFDAPAQILLSLKDIMTSGYFRKGKQQFKVKTKLIIGLTNKSKEDFSEDESLEAFVQRFPVTKKVEWDSYTKVDFMNLFKKRFDETSDYFKKHKMKFNELASIIDLNNSVGSGFVSPRTAVQAAQLYAFGSSLDLISDLDKDVVKKYFKENKNSELIQASQDVLRKADEYLESIQSSCKSLDGESDEVENEVLQMLAGATTNFGIEKKLEPKDLAVVKLSVNKLTWLQAHVQGTSIVAEMEQDKKDFLEKSHVFKKKLIKIMA